MPERRVPSAPWIVLASIVALAVVYVLLPTIGMVFARFRGIRGLACPETGQDAKVRVDARWAAFTAAFRHPIAARRGPRSVDSWVEVPVKFALHSK